MNKSSDEVIKYKAYLLATLALDGDFDATAGLCKKVLLVEGATDRKFIEQIKGADTSCHSVMDIMRNRDAFITSHSLVPGPYNNKQVITTILKHIAFFPEYSDFPKGAETWPLYGLVDNDFDNENDYARVTKLFFTDTHDLETLMLSTDKNLLARLKQCLITEDEVKKALFIANQMAAFRKAIKSNGNMNLGLISEQDGTIAFQKFTDGIIINIAKLLQHINDKSERLLSKEKLKATRESIIKNLKNKVDKEGSWKKSFDTFNVTTDTWMDVNGHDVLSAICYLNPGVRETFNNRGGHSQNRDFEFALTEAYDYNCLKKTKLHAKLQAAGLLRE